MDDAFGVAKDRNVWVVGRDDRLRPRSSADNGFDHRADNEGVVEVIFRLSRTMIRSL